MVVGPKMKQKKPRGNPNVDSVNRMLTGRKKHYLDNPFSGATLMFLLYSEMIYYDYDCPKYLGKPLMNSQAWAKLRKKLETKGLIKEISIDNQDGRKKFFTFNNKKFIEVLQAEFKNYFLNEIFQSYKEKVKLILKEYIAFIIKRGPLKDSGGIQTRREYVIKKPYRLARISKFLSKTKEENINKQFLKKHPNLIYYLHLLQNENPFNDLIEHKIITLKKHYNNTKNQDDKEFYQEEIREIIDGKIETLIEKTQNLKKVLEIEINKLIKQPTFEDTIWLAPYIMKEFKIDFTKQFSIYNLFFSIVRRMAMDYRANFYYTKSKKDILKINLKINPKLLPYLEYSLWYCLINNVDISDYNAALQASSIIIQKKMRRKKKK